MKIVDFKILLFNFLNQKKYFYKFKIIKILISKEISWNYTNLKKINKFKNKISPETTTWKKC